MVWTSEASPTRRAILFIQPGVNTLKPTASSGPVAGPIVPGKPVEIAEFLNTYRRKLKHLFHVRTDIDKLSLNRFLPPFVM